MKRFLSGISICLFLFAFTGTASAQLSLELGPRVGYDIGGDIDEIFLGVDLRAGLADIPVDLGASFDYYLMEENISFYQIGINAYYPFVLADAPVAPYVGAGLSISRMTFDFGDEFGDFFGSSTASSSDTGLNLIGGARFPMGSVIPFAQAQFTVGDLNVFTIGGGLLIPISR
jgi:opacity protein-like surface antigen